MSILDLKMATMPPGNHLKSIKLRERGWHCHFQFPERKLFGVIWKMMTISHFDTPFKSKLPTFAFKISGIGHLIY